MLAFFHSCSLWNWADVCGDGWVVGRRYEQFLADLVAKACIEACPETGAPFNVDYVRVVKVGFLSSFSSPAGSPLSLILVLCSCAVSPLSPCSSHDCVQ